MSEELKRAGEPAKGGDDPSMEDILASIRRIIAEDGEARDAETAAAADKGAGDVLDLTEMVADDGSVVSLPPRFFAAEPEPEFSPEAEAMPEPESAAAPEMVPEPEFAPVAAAPAPVTAVPVATAPVAPALHPDPKPLENFTAEAHAATPARKEAVMSSAVPPHDSLVSAPTANLARNAFAQLAEATRPPVAARESVAQGEGRTVEQLAEDLLRPMLKAWLDAHLPAIVEKAVTAELARITGRNS